MNTNRKAVGIVMLETIRIEEAELPDSISPDFKYSAVCVHHYEGTLYLVALLFLEPLTVHIRMLVT